MRHCLLALLLVCSIALADPKLFVFFINGINTTPDDADANLSKLESLIDLESDNITWDVLYNQTHGVIRSDVWDVMRQKHAERLGLDYIEYRKKYPRRKATSFLDDRSYSGKNLADIVEQFHIKVPSDLNDVYVLIISHSQGNQYANQLADYLVNAEGFPQNRIGIIGIASPANKGYGDNFVYVTADNDKVINMVRFFPESPLPANAHIEKCYDFSCHNLVMDYLGDSVIRKSICQHIGSYMNLWLNMQPLC